jgi:hypothetical protein
VFRYKASTARSAEAGIPEARKTSKRNLLLTDGKAAARSQRMVADVSEEAAAILLSTSRSMMFCVILRPGTKPR